MHSFFKLGATIHKSNGWVPTIPLQLEQGPVVNNTASPRKAGTTFINIFCTRKIHPIGLGYDRYATLTIGPLLAVEEPGTPFPTDAEEESQPSRLSCSTCRTTMGNEIISAESCLHLLLL